jgi:PAS domain S-box-containing protein
VSAHDYKEAPSERDELFLRALDVAATGMLLTSPGGHLARVNQAFASMLGFEAEDLLGRSDTDLTHPDDRDASRRQQHRLESGEAESFQLVKRYVAKDGRPVWVLLSVTGVREEDGSLRYAIAQVQDLSRQRQAEEALRRRDTILSAVAASAEQLLGASDYTEVIDGVLRILGESAGASRCYLFENYRGPGGRLHTSLHSEWCAPGIEQQIDNPKLQNLSVDDVLADSAAELGAGRAHQAHTNDVPEPHRGVLAAQGIRSYLAVPIMLGDWWWGFMGFDECLTERVWAETEVEALRTAAGALSAAIHRRDEAATRQDVEERYRLLVENLPLVTYVDHADEQISGIYVSPQIEDMLGYRPEEWLADPGFFRKVLHPDDRQVAFEGTWPEGPGPHVYEYRLIARDGRVVWIHDQYMLVRDEDDRPLFSQGFMIDITERKQAEENLRRRDAVLEAVAACGELLLAAHDWEDAIDDVLRELGTAAGVSRAYVFERHEAGGHPVVSQLYEWCADGIEPQLDRPEMQDLRLETPGFDEILARLAEGNVVHGSLDELPAGVRVELEAQGIKSLALVPIFAGEEWWGMCGLDECIAERVWTRAEIEALRAAAGILGGAIYRQRAEAGRREAEERYRTLVDASPIAIVVLDLEDTVQLWNEAAERTYGWTADESIGQPLRTRPPDLEHEFHMLRDAGHRGERITSYETRRRRKDGRMIDVSISVAPVRDASGKIVGVLGAHVDITEAKRAEQALRDRERQFRAVFDTSQDGLLILDDDLRMLEVNAAAAEIFGMLREELVGRGADELPALQQLTETQPVWAELVEQGSLDREWELHRPDGAIRNVEVAMRANFLPGRHIALMRDVTERKALEAQLLHSQRMEAVGRLAGGIAHDFNNLLTAIQGYSDFLLAELATGSEPWRDAEQIARAAERAEALVRQLLAFSRKQMLRPEVIDLNAVVRDIESMLRRLIGEDIELGVELDPELEPVNADAAQVEQTIINLVVNARDAMPDGGALHLRTGNVTIDETAAENAALEHGRYARITVEDTGAGMDESTRLRAFEPFFTTKAHGTGLGLSTVYGIVTQSGGTIDVASEPGRGTTFAVYLPAAAGSSRRMAPGVVERASNGGTETVLLVEDEEVVRGLTLRILADSGYEVLEASSGEEALRVAGGHDGRIDLLVTDVVMSGMNGRELADRLLDSRPDTRVLYMSGYTEDAVIQRGVSGERAFLGKPFTPGELTRTVRQVLDAAA